MSFILVIKILTNDLGPGPQGTFYQKFLGYDFRENYFLLLNFSSLPPYLTYTRHIQIAYTKLHCCVQIIMTYSEWACTTWTDSEMEVAHEIS